MEKQIPEFLKTMLIEQYGEEIANKIIDGYSKQRYVTLRANTIKATNEEIKKELKNSNIEYKEIEWYKDALIIKNVKEYIYSRIIKKIIIIFLIIFKM